MFTSQRPPDDDPREIYSRILIYSDFPAILHVISHHGSGGLTGAQRVALAEIVRLSGAHPDPRVRDRLKVAMDHVRIAHLEYCLKRS